MKFLKIITIIAFTIIFIAACQRTESRRSGIVLAQSKSYEASLYRQNCAICHGQEANGKQIGNQLVPSLRFGDIEKKSEEEIYRQIAFGKLPMPAFKNQLTEEEIRKLVRFIKKDLQGKE